MIVRSAECNAARSYYKTCFYKWVEAHNSIPNSPEGLEHAWNCFCRLQWVFPRVIFSLGFKIPFPQPFLEMKILTPSSSTGVLKLALAEEDTLVLGHKMLQHATHALTMSSTRPSIPAPSSKSTVTFKLVASKKQCWKWSNKPRMRPLHKALAVFPICSTTLLVRQVYQLLRTSPTFPFKRQHLASWTNNHSGQIWRALLEGSGNFEGEIYLSFLSRICGTFGFWVFESDSLATWQVCLSLGKHQTRNTRSTEINT